MGTVLLSLQANPWQLSQHVSSAILSMTSALILIGMLYTSKDLNGITPLIVHVSPTRNHFMASTGNNGSVQLWQDGRKVDDGCCEYLCSYIVPTSCKFLLYSDKYPRAPHDVVYREKDSLMAVTCMNGYVFI